MGTKHRLGSPSAFEAKIRSNSWALSERMSGSENSTVKPIFTS